jgi:hypothetical protein
VPVVFSLRIGGVFHVKSCVSAVIDFVLLHIPYVVHNIESGLPQHDVGASEGACSSHAREPPTNPHKAPSVMNAIKLGINP